ncbi:MAG: SDR family NAD(P)-dependent oxidoreductase, partial [Chitinophagaceae bacterium]|nr:SDR family NAD(P)-dependent oxidoreductase [Chitinophagaceae bacterium]
MKRIVLITGATAGFGQAMALRFAAEGYDVIITGRRAERLQALADQINTLGKGRCLPLCFDVRQREACLAAVAGLPAEWQPIDILINNAGGAWGRDRADQANLDDWDTMLDTNVKGLMYMTKAVLPQMTDRRQGHIINMGSIAGKEPYENGNGYNAAKFAVEGFSRALRIDMLPFNIKVSHVAPGAAETEFSLVRFKGDAGKAAAVYQGYQALQATDVADIVYYVASLPPHVCINDLVVTP